MQSLAFHSVITFNYWFIVDRFKGSIQEYVHNFDVGSYCFLKYNWLIITIRNIELLASSFFFKLLSINFQYK